MSNILISRRFRLHKDITQTHATLELFIVDKAMFRVHECIIDELVIPKKQGLPGNNRTWLSRQPFIRHVSQVIVHKYLLRLSENYDTIFRSAASERRSKNISSRANSPLDGSVISPLI